MVEAECNEIAATPTHTHTVRFIHAAGNSRFARQMRLQIRRSKQMEKERVGSEPRI